MKPPEYLAVAGEGTTPLLSLSDARAIADGLTQRQVRPNLGGSVHDPADPADPVGRLQFNVLAIVAEFSVISTRRASDVPTVGTAA